MKFTRQQKQIQNKEVLHHLKKHNITKEDIRSTVKGWIDTINNPNISIVGGLLKQSNNEYCVLGCYAKTYNWRFEYDSKVRQYYLEGLFNKAFPSSYMPFMPSYKQVELTMLNDKLMDESIYPQKEVKAVLVKKIKNWLKYQLSLMEK
jgi:hypothetical protein